VPLPSRSVGLTQGTIGVDEQARCVLEESYASSTQCRAVAWGTFVRVQMRVCSREPLEPDPVRVRSYGGVAPSSAPACGVDLVCSNQVHFQTYLHVRGPGRVACRLPAHPGTRLAQTCGVRRSSVPPPRAVACGPCDVTCRPCDVTVTAGGHFEAERRVA